MECEPPCTTAEPSTPVSTRLPTHSYIAYEYPDRVLINEVRQDVGKPGSGGAPSTYSVDLRRRSERRANNAKPRG